MRQRTLFRLLPALLLALALLATASLAPRASRPARADGGPTLEQIEARIEALESRGFEADYLEAYLWRMRQRAYPNNRVDWSAYPRAYAQQKRMPAASSGDRLRPAPQRWEFLGPTNLPVPYQIYYGQGKTNGRINGVAFSPTAGTYFLAAAGGGVWKTTNSGVTWTPLSDGWTNIKVSSVAVHPTNPNIVYAGTGDFDGGFSSYGFGVMKSTNGGTTWTNLGASQFSGASIQKILIDPENPNLLTLTLGKGLTSGKVFRSTDAGVTWTTAISTTAHWCGLSYGALSGGNRVYYAAGEGTGGQVWRSLDRGATWTKLNPPLGTGYQDGIDVAASLTAPNTVYLLSGANEKVYKSTDAGATWTDTTNNFPADDQTGDRYNWSQEWYDLHIACSTNPSNGQDMVYVGLIDFVASRDGGATWQSVGRTYTSGALTHNDQHCMAVNPTNPNDVLVGNDGGIYRLAYTPSSGTWAFDTTVSARLGITQFYRAAFHPTDPTRMLGGTQDNATPAALGDLGNWDNVGGGDGGFCAINPQNPSVQYTTSQNLFLYRTGNQWTTTTSITPNFGTDRKAFIAPITLDASNPDRLYAGTNFLWRYTDSTSTWTPRLGNQQLASGTGTLSYIAVAPTDGNRIYTGAGSSDVWTTPDGGNTWTQIDAGLPNRFVTGIHVNSANAKSVLVGFSGTGTGHLWLCADTTASPPVWTNVSGSGATGLPDIPLNGITSDPTDTTFRKWYVGTDVGVFATTDGGATWTNATAPLGLPNVEVDDVTVVRGTGYLMANTFGRGMWRLQLPSLQTSFSVAGTVRLNGLGASGVTVRAGTASAITAADGSYRITGLPAGNYNVTPSRSGFFFTPAIQPLTLGPDLIEVDFAATANVPKAPTNLRAAGATTSQIRLTWQDNSGDESGFRIERKIGTGSFAEIRVVGANVTAYTDGSFGPGTTCTYRVRAYNVVGPSPYSNEATGRTLGPPLAATDLRLTLLNSTSVRLTWQDNSNDESGFKVERKTGTEAFRVVTVVGADGTTATSSGLLPNTAYTFRVTAYNGYGSTPSAPAAITTLAVR